ncbi:hypothetical protein BAUCODRAFT_37791 [Baudoinia panamericana UAMH 10762]|uniref:Uncharacterized protein n=1 Tax=Baudoinia panamericana (strain UAMH 10762) TaxID=717646 RepID=M2MN54_BAUPA|nr:uncharacterized protein BAUCODRAFT_37791 [Baudoinia panamericana UAMH 10762]EMC92878.1 hypothetical protein BAUCODRAFT_37791 [Baudoinia panamericana UAMH 10762]
MSAKQGSKRSNQVGFEASSSSSQIPAPFTKAPTSLVPFLQQCDPAQVYLTHIDRHPPDYKRQIFLIPVILNGSIAVLLAWRIYAALPTYWAIVQTLLGYPSATTVDPKTTTRRQQILILLRRVLMFFFDFLLFRFVGPWPLTFFLEQPSNPVVWRWNIGFVQEEVVVRVSRNWNASDLMQGIKQGDDSPFFKTRILPAIEKQFMRSKTGYLMMDKSWDLDFQLMLDAHTLVRRKEVKINDLDKLVLVHQDGVGWLAWQWETENDVIEDRRKRVVAFKDKLTGMGKESLFFKWMEIVESERDADGSFTIEAQQKVVKRVQAAFESEGIDFEELSRTIGGLEELPAKQAAE